MRPLSSELLLGHVLGLPRIKLYTDYDRVLSDADRGRLRDLVARAGEHEPIVDLTGKGYFLTSSLNSCALRTDPQA